MKQNKCMIAVGSDHAGFELKHEVIKHLEEQGFLLKDLGSHTPAPIDYPYVAKDTANVILSGECTFGILICGTGIGMSIAANKIGGIRAAVCSDTYSTRLTRMHNNANILCIGARVIGSGIALELVDTFVNTPFEGGRHQKRIDLVTELEGIV